jgi:YggT family protein
MQIFFVTIDFVLEIYTWILVALAALDLLRGFGVIDAQTGPLGAVYRFLYKATAPALWPIRRLMPELGGVDLSPVRLIAVWAQETDLASATSLPQRARPIRQPMGPR